MPAGYNLFTLRTVMSVTAADYVQGDSSVSTVAALETLMQVLTIAIALSTVSAIRTAQCHSNPRWWDGVIVEA